MNIRKILALHGPNVWGAAPMLEVWLDCQAESSLSADQLQQVAERSLALAAPFLEATDFQFDPQEQAAAPLVLSRWLEAMIRKLQRLCGIEMPAGHIVASTEPAVCRVAIRFEDEGLVRPALKVAQALLSAALAGSTYDFATELRSLQSWANKLCLGPSTRAIVEAARSRGIPVRRLNISSLVQFGHGAQQRRICTAETDGTGAIAESIAQDKELTKTLLRRVGVPVPEGRAVASAADAWDAANEIGTPVVVKPRDANHGRGVAIRLSTREEIMASYELAAEEGSGVIVEQYVAGLEHRLLVVGNQVVAVARGEPDVLIGDGRSTIQQLVHLANLDPRRGDEFSRPMCKIEIDPLCETLLEQQGYTADSIPPAGGKVIMHYNGEYTTDVTDHVHPETASLAVLAARVIGLDVAGIDLVTPDISRPLEPRRGMIIEVNAGPGLQMHAAPQIGRPRPVGAAIIETLFPEGQTGRIPVVGIAEAPAAATCALATAHLMGTSGWNVGLVSSAGTWVGNRFLGAQRGRPTAADLLLNPFVEATVLEVSPSAVYSEGLPFDDCDVAVVLESPSTTESAEESETWRRILVESVSPLGTAIFAADDPRAQRLAACCRGDVLFCHASPAHPLLVAQRVLGHKIGFWRDGAIWVASQDREVAIAQSIPSASGEANPPALPVMLAACAAWSAGASVERLAQALPSLAAVLATGSLEPDQPRAA